jgi:hypothetical protein
MAPEHAGTDSTGTTVSTVPPAPVSPAGIHGPSTTGPLEPAPAGTTEVNNGFDETPANDPPASAGSAGSAGHAGHARSA